MFLFALTMIFGESKPDSELRLAQDQHETAIFPLAVPSIASPGAMLAAVLLTENARFSIPEQMQTFLVLLAVLGLTCVLMLLSSSIQRILGKSGPIVISRIMGLILSSVAMTSLLSGIESYFGLA